MRRALRSTAAICLLACATCVPFSTAAQSGAPATVDAEVFAAVVGDLRAATTGRTLLVDPRTLQPGMEVSGLDSADVGPGTPARIRALEELGVARTDILSDLQCLFSGGLRPPPPPGGAAPDPRGDACRARPAFRSALIGALRAGASADEVSVPVYYMTTGSYHLYEYVLRREGTRWSVVARTTVFEMYS